MVRKSYLFLFGIVLIFLMMFFVKSWTINPSILANQSDGFSETTSTQVQGIITNETDFWFVDVIDNFIYHVNRTGTNYSDGFSVAQIFGSSVSPDGMCGNSTDIYLNDDVNGFLQHSTNGVNQSDGFELPLGLNTVTITGVACNSSNTGFYFLVNNVPTAQNTINWTDKNGNHLGGFSIRESGATDTYDIVTNDSDFWVIDSSDNWMYHFDRNGNNLSDGFLAETSDIGTTDIYSMTANRYGFYFSDLVDDFIYHYGMTFGITPNLTILIPLINNSNTTNINQNINFTFSDSTGIFAVWYNNDTTSVANKSLGGGGTFFNITNITWSEGKHNVTIYINNSVGNLNYTSISFTIDTINPNLNITQPEYGRITANLTPLIELSITETNLDSCWVNVTRADNNGSAPVPTIQITNCDTGNRTAVVPAGGTLSNSVNYIAWGLINDSAGNSNLSYSPFTTPASAGGGSPTGGSSGGGSPTGLTQAQNFSITTTNLKDVLDFSLPKESARARKLNFLLINEGIKELEVDVECSVEGVNKSSRGIQICNYVKFNKTSFKVSPNKLNPTIGTFEVESPPDAEYGDIYYFTIIAKTDENTFDKLSVNANVNIFSTIYKWSSINGFIFPLVGVSFALSSISALTIFFIFVKIKRPIFGTLLSFPIAVLMFISLIILFPTEI